MKEKYLKILKIFANKKSEKIYHLRTRDIADAAELTIYQARQRLEYLNGIGMVESVASGKGKSTIWKLIN
ncbi:TPA: hypothetical protein L9M98_004686 [Klebsiella pneumoniae]|nr:hypothetical protein [Klebsiella pneumoniae]